VDHWYARIPPCKVLFEFKDVPIETLRKLYRRIAPRFGFKTKLIRREPLVDFIIIIIV
jgi:ribosomal protein L16/L10AE